MLEKWVGGFSDRGRGRGLMLSTMTTDDDKDNDLSVSHLGRFVAEYSQMRWISGGIRP